MIQSLCHTQRILYVGGYSCSCLPPVIFLWFPTTYPVFLSRHWKSREEEMSDMLQNIFWLVLLQAHKVNIVHWKGLSRPLEGNQNFTVSHIILSLFLMRAIKPVSLAMLQYLILILFCIEYLWLLPNVSVISPNWYWFSFWCGLGSLVCLYELIGMKMRE